MRLLVLVGISPDGDSGGCELMTLSEQFPNEMLPVKVIKLTRGGFTIIDPEDFERITSCGSWNMDKKGYAIHGVRDPDGRWKSARHEFMHNLIRGANGTDHKNRVKLDNRRANLRAVTDALNTANQKIRSDNRAGLKGVQHLPGGGWRATISQGGKDLHLGVFASREDAGYAYDRKALEIFGEYACTNQMQRLLPPDPGHPIKSRPRPRPSAGTLAKRRASLLAYNARKRVAA